MVSYPAINLVDSVIDEVALEGLDGITLEALWKRLAHRLHEPLPFLSPFMTQIWSICVQVKEFRFYELSEPRGELIIFDRYEFVDPDFGIILEPDVVPDDIYPHCPVHDTENGIKGSCSTYYSRRDITDVVRRLLLEEAVKKYGQKLVVVASQQTRDRALMGVDVCPTLELNAMQYCFLERVGRSRYHGEVTQGKLSLNALKEDPKSLFYHRKFLLRYKLITKQFHHQKSGGHSCNGSLLHLPRFFVERKPKMIFLAEQVIEILKSKPNYIAEYDEIKKKLQIENSIRKLFKTSFFQKVVRTDLRAPYRTLYPNAKPSEWQRKNYPSKERMIKVVQLLVPDIDISEAWNKEEIQEEEDPQELDISCHKYNVPYLKQVNALIEAKKSEGVCQGGLSREMGLTKLQSRTILRNLIKAKIVATYMDDIGRQRLAKFVSKKFEKGSKISKDFKKEMHKIKQLTKQINVDNAGQVMNKMNEAKKNVETLTMDKAEITKEPNTIIINNKDDNKSETKLVKPVIKSVAAVPELTKTFRIVNRILRKYRLTKYVSKYKYTSSNVLTTSQEIEQSKEAKKNLCKSLSIFQDISSNPKASSLYNNVKTCLTVLKPLNTRKTVNEVFGFMEDVEKNEKKNVPNITYRLLRRANMIIEAVKEHRIIDDMTKLTKMIHEEEDKEGYDVKIDKKSLLRLLQKLAKDNLVKNIKLSLNAHGREKHLTFICDPNIDTNDAVIQSAVEQAKLKFCLVLSQKIKSPRKETNNVDFNKGKLRNTGGEQKTDEKLKTFQHSRYDHKVGRKYGFSPKFVRMKVLHLLLYYLVYDHPGEQILSKGEQVQALRANGFNISDELAEEFNTIYCTEISWKMFVPPVPKHFGWPRGWTLICDILLRIPLSLFLKIHCVPFVIPELESYINHPIKRHYLVRDLPIEIRNPLLHQRKYIFDIHQTVMRLCYIGLAQFGPQRLKEKDQVFIYVNRHAELLDTTSSAPSYHIIEDKSYPVIRYTFTEMQVVEKYWYDMWNTCINTPLGGRLVVQGKDILLEELSKKAAMIKSVEPRTAEEAIKLDTGQVPGDRKGAAGIDSACFAHLKRNWNWSLGNSASVAARQAARNRKDGPHERETYLSKIKAKPLKFTEFPGLKKVSGPIQVTTTELRKKATKSKSEESTSQEKKCEPLTPYPSTKQKAFVRRVMPRKCRSRRTKYDEVDYRALQRMSKLRVDWEPHEDKILLICKVAMMYLCPNPRKQIVTFTAVRDVLRTYSFVSYNKTSRACQRRLLYMLRNPQTVNSVTVGVEEVRQNAYVAMRYGDITEKLKLEYKNSHEYEERVAEEFRSLVHYVAKKYYDISEIGPKKPQPVPKTAQEFNMFYKVEHAMKAFNNRGFTKDVRTISDIHSATINSVIHSSMCCAKDRRSWAYQLFKVYQQYPEMLLRNAMAKVRADQIVTVKKNHMCTIKKYGNYMPMSSSQYQLSTNYIFKFHAKWPYDIFKEAYEVFVKLTQWYCENKLAIQSKNTSEVNGVEISPATGGIVGAIHDYMCQSNIDFDIELPDQIITLDPRLREIDETYYRIAQRYQDILACLDHLKFVKEPLSRANAGTCEYNVQDEEYFNSELDKLNDDNNSTSNIAVRSRKCGDVDAERDNACSKENTDEIKSFEDTKDFMDCGDLNFDSDEDNYCNIIEDDSNVIKFQDGTKIVLNRRDIEDSDSCIDENSRDSNEVIKNTSSKIEVMTPAEINRALSLECANEDQHKECSSISNKRQKDVSEENLDEPQRKKSKLSDKKLNAEMSRGENVISDGSSEAHIATKERINDSKKSESSVEVAESGIEEQNANTKKENENKFTRVSDILQSTSSDNYYYSNSYCKIEETNDAQRRYTRIDLLRMREELSGLTVADSHHAHEYFAVNMFKIFHSLEVQNSEQLKEFKGLKIPAELLPLKANAANELIRDVSKFAVFPKNNVSYSDFKKTLPKNMLLDFNAMDAVYKFVRDKKEMGATIQELLDKFQSTLDNDWYRIVALLIENHLFLRTGVTIVRYIHHRYVDPWLINSYKIHTLEKESLLPVPRGTVYLTESGKMSGELNVNILKEANDSNAVFVDVLNSSENDLVSELQPPNTSNRENEKFEREQSSNSEDECTAPTKKRMQRKRTQLLPQRDISRSAKQLDFTTAEEIRVVIKPWIRIDGGLNRRVLDRMLGAVLTYCLTHPGITLSKVQSRFVPALQPFHTRELVEMLIKLECLEQKVMEKPHVSLFSKPSAVRASKVNGEWPAEEDITIEPSLGAMLKFGIFLSTKMYNTDYIV